MAKAEVGTPKYVANKMKSKGLQRLRWYCQVCEKQCRDENGFKCHTESESHMRKILSVGENARSSIEEYSKQFKSDFLLLLRTGHGEKPINANRFYQEYICNKEHIHMNATKWHSLNEFVKYLGREGICRVSNDDDSVNGLTIAWIDNSPDALKRQEALKRRQTGEKGEEEQLQIGLERQMKEAQKVLQQRELREKELAKINNDSDKQNNNCLQRDKSLNLAFSLKKTSALSSSSTKTPEIGQHFKKGRGSGMETRANSIFRLGSSKVSKPTVTKKPMTVFEKVMLKDKHMVKVKRL